MRPRTQAAVLVALGGLLLWLGSGDLMLRLVLPSFRIPLLLTGLVLAVLGVATWRATTKASSRPPPEGAPSLDAAAPTDSPDHHGHQADHTDHAAPRIGLLLLAPVLLILAFGIRPLGPPSRPAPKTSGFLSSIETLNPRPGTTIRPAARPDIDLDAPVIPTTINWLTSAPWADPGAVELRQRVRLVGYANGKAPSGFTLSRYSIWCCVADGNEVNIDVITETSIPDGTWVEITGVYVPPPSGADLALRSTRHGFLATEPPVPVDEPADPYEH